MPSKHKIINGPPFKHFFFSSQAVSGSGNISGFTFTDWNRDDERTSFSIMLLGQPFLQSGESEEGNVYRFIAKSHRGSHKLRLPSCYIVGQYNTSTREGFCHKFERKELDRNPLAQTLFELD